MESFEKISLLILGTLREDIKEEDALSLSNWIRSSKDNIDFFGQFENGDALGSKLTAFRDADTASIWQKTLEKIDTYPATNPWTKTVIAGMFARRWRVVAAVAIGFLLTGSLYLFLHPAAMQQKGVVKVDPSVIVPSAPSTASIVPGGNRATLTLGNGLVIVLDQLKNGLMAEQGRMRIEKTGEGELSYTPAGAASPVNNGDNILATPRGGQYKVILPDGTRVWMNAGSSLKYPVASGDHARRVELSGEAYFEVARSSAPFKVFLNPIKGIRGEGGPGSFVEVLGTRFNIMAYPDEPASRTTLFEGSVKISAGSAPLTIKPGQQAIVADSTATVLVVHASGHADAWVAGSIPFDGQDLSVIMRELSRWYDVEVEYAGEIPAFRLDGSISRNSSIGDVLKILNVQGGKELGFTLEGRRIIVKGKLKS